MLKLEDFYQPVGGLMTYANQLPSNPGEPHYPIYGSSLGDLNQVSLFKARGFQRKLEMTGAGGDVDAEQAKIKAIAETLERYCSCVYKDEQFILATANELEGEALDLDDIPQVSEEEAQHPDCIIGKPDKNKKIRWVRGMSLTQNRLIWVPAVMTYLYIPLHDNERFWIPISTGCAIHRSYEEALINGINEIVERDSIALTWLHRLELPKLEINESLLPSWVLEFYHRVRDQPFFETEFFNATTDLGIPSIYSVQTTPYNSKVASLVMATTDLDPMIAFSKILREGASLRIALQNKEIDEKPIDQFMDVMDGALYMGKKENMHKFDFLKKSKRVNSLHEMPSITSGDLNHDLVYLINKLKEKGHEVIAVDLTTDEARRSGMRAVRVIIPSLMPLSFVHRARFLGTKRLYDAPVKMGYGIRTQDDINPDPQPFA